jgi:hypothetical protein
MKIELENQINRTRERADEAGQRTTYTSKVGLGRGGSGKGVLMFFFPMRSKKI